MKIQNYLPLLLSSCLVIAVSSCQRDVDFPDVNPPEVVDDIAVSRVVELDTSYASGLDTSMKFTLIYDAQKRLVQVNDTAFDDGTHTIQFVGVENRFYSGTDTLPYKFTRWETTAGGEDIRDTTYFIYQPGGQVIVRDSTVQYYMRLPWTKTVQKYYDLGGGGYYIDKAGYDYSTGLLISRDSVRLHRTYLAGNITAMADSAIEPFTLYIRYSYRYNYVYDTKKNPFARTLLPYMVQQRNGNTKADFSDYAFLNNPLSFTFTSMLGITSSSGSGQAFYTYNSDDYPVIIRYHSSSFTNKNKTLLFYTTL